MERMERAQAVGRAQLGAAELPKTGERERFDAYEAITSRIIERLETGVVPWQSPSIARVGFPRNFSTGKFYSGINVFLLGSQEFQSPYFLTFIQARELGGFVRKGEKGFPVIKVGTWTKDTEESPGTEGGGAEVEQRKFLKLYTVFNACQIEGIEFPEVPKCATFTESAMSENARQIVAAMPSPPGIFEGRKSFPHYVPELDTVEMPSRETFRAEWRFYKTLFHELTHATGHPSRLNRESLTENRGRYAVGDAQKTYCLEELVAEMGAAFLGARAGIIEDGFENSAAYLKGWLDVLKVRDHKTWLVKAASEAQKAADFILGLQRTHDAGSSAK
jgi:antirestriction protein ArdC